MLRRALRRAIVRALPDLRVIAYTEIPNELQIEAEAVIQLRDVVPEDNQLAQVANAAAPGTVPTAESADLSSLPL
jgi:hypothetical protein